MLKVGIALIAIGVIYGASSDFFDFFRVSRTLRTDSVMSRAPFSVRLEKARILTGNSDERHAIRRGQGGIIAMIGIFLAIFGWLATQI